MGHLEWLRDAACDQPVIVAAWSGWGDAGNAASTALDTLRHALDAEPIGRFDAEPFFVFSDARPTVTTTSGRRHLEWPTVTVSRATAASAVDLLLVGGPEPQLRWPTFCNEIMAMAADQRARLILTLGAVAADIPHSRPTPVYGNAQLPNVLDALGFEPPTDEGPVGVHDALHAMCADRLVNSAALWAVVPSYVSATESPKAALALIERLGNLIGTDLAPHDLESRATAYEREIATIVDADAEMSAYVQRLEEMYDSRQLADETGEHFVAQIERFLRGREG